MEVFWQKREETADAHDATNHMKALILAAGYGSRLAPLTDEIPKALVRVNGKPIIIQQLESLSANGITDITVVAGYKASLLKQAVLEAFPGVSILESAEYAATNNMYSAYLARDLLAGEAFLMMNADVFFDASVLTALLEYPAENAVVTEIGRYLEESMKVTQHRGQLNHIAKKILPEEALGTSIDVYKFSPEGGRVFFNCCREYIETKKERTLWSEVALDNAMQQIPFFACPLQGRWFEIDDLDDLNAAEKLFQDPA